MTYLGTCCTRKRVEECGMNGAVSECERFEAGQVMDGHKEVCLTCIENELEASMREARSLAESLWRKHYKEEAPHWEVLDTPSGIITQINNMVCGLVKPPPEREKP